jgi:hypothetical protein
VIHLLFVPVLILGADSVASDKFSDVQIEKPFDRYLRANPLLMEATGAKIITLRNGGHVVLSVASTVLKNKTAADRLRAEKVCRTKAFAYVAQERKGVHVFHSEDSTDKTVVVTKDGEEHGTNVSEFLEVTNTKVDGIAKDMPVVGRWKSKDGDVFYMAIGAMLDKEGKAVETNPPDPQ